ncbi:hypothetical protein ACW9HR_37080 [Nocardia gipuzkoensis]
MTYLGRTRREWKTYLDGGIETSRRPLTEVVGREPGANGVVARLVERGGRRLAGP